MTDQIGWIEADLNRYREAFMNLGLPEGMWPGVRNYMAHGTMPGHFLNALLRNNLSDAIAHGDDDSLEQIRQWVMFLYNSLPGNSWGTRESFEAWMNKGGLYGIHNASK